MNSAPEPVPDHRSTVAASAIDSAVARLARLFADDRLSIEDYERRVELANRAQTPADLQRAVDGLPEQPEPTPPAPAPSGPPHPAGTGASHRAPATNSAQAHATPEQVRDNDRLSAIFGEAKRAGRWVPAKDTEVLVVMGETTLDLRDTLLGPGESSFFLQVYFGSVQIIVTPEQAVDCGGSMIFGEFAQHQANRGGAPDTPLIRIDGNCVFGSVEVDVRYAGETKRDARRRRRRETSDHD